MTKSNLGGAQRYVTDLAVNLPREEFEVVVAAGGNGPLFGTLQKHGIRTHHINGLDRDVRATSDWRAFRHIQKIIGTEAPDIIHLNSSKMGGVGAIAGFLYNLRRLLQKKSTARIIFTIHGWGFFEDRSPPVRALIFLASLASSFFQHHIIVLNRHDLAAAKRFIPGKKLALIPNGIPPARGYSPADARSQLTKLLGSPIPSGSFLIATIAELTKNKNIACLVKAIAEVKTKQPERSLHAIVFGEGEERKRLEESIARYGLQTTITLAGFVPYAARFLPAFDLFVLPSTKEGLPYSIMEAMVAGIPVIATRVGGIPDLIEHEKQGLLVAPKNSQAFANAIAYAVTHHEQRAAWGAAGREKQMRHFTLHAMLQKTTALYNNETHTI
ncbi:MAG: glycosyltransferase family 4 protein [bacterium]|nr:glycosyltransferase family 4 protein [bacterium]